MTVPDDTPGRLVRHFRMIEQKHMRGLPIVNPGLAVEAVGFREFGEHLIGVLITPWFMNLMLVPGTDEYSALGQGAVLDLSLPGDRLAFTVSHDVELGTYLSAVLFRSMNDFPDQALAREIGKDILERLFAGKEAGSTKTIGRRELFTRFGAG